MKDKNKQMLTYYSIHIYIKEYIKNHILPHRQSLKVHKHTFTHQYTYVHARI